VRPHAAMGAVMLIASADELKKEQAAGDQLIDMIAPLLQQLSLGSVLGYATGYALRVVGQMAAFAVGSVFMLVQIAAYKGYINVNWKQISGDTKKGLLDQVPLFFLSTHFLGGGASPQYSRVISRDTKRASLIRMVMVTSMRMI
jgi:uncharacterized membrane protein (Fun14 family)